ncbi:hypothetical protein CLPUN_02100 [Clostridium puniceum]|uniref:Phage portal protein n=1 Tax=Clostridium puniceum TaxID=29367 RepID=A0A1S8TXQ9_9CLOT|nr:YmfQ family protein [Clostridium puniceum]OOM82508.1 hypothetical protein CLPUN_02100 [Clostridium puniceum]
MYGINEYGTISYADNLAFTEEVTKRIPNLMKYLPKYYYTSNVMKNVQGSNGIELGLLDYKLDDILDQLLIETATWGLDYWEKEYGLETNKLLSYEERREIVRAKKRGRGTTTIAMIKNTAEAFSGGEVSVIPHNEQYYFTVHFIGIKGIPRNMQAFKDMLETIKPAHLNYDFAFTYNTYGDIRDNSFDYGRLENYSHDLIRTTDDIKKGMNI